jgi:hypothetical protein
MGIRFRVRKVMFWGTFFLLTSLAGVLGFAYWYVTDSETLASLIKAESPRYLPGARLEMTKARVWPLIGKINLTQVHLLQVIDGTPFLAVRIPWLQIKLDPRALLKRRFVPQEVVVAQPTLRLRRRDDGTWNLDGLLANPWPGPPMKGTPPIIIQNGTVELVEDESHKGVAILREVAVRIEQTAPGRLMFEGSAKGDAFDRLNLQGTVDVTSGRVTLNGDVARLAISETLRRRLPAEYRPACERVGLTSGEADLRIGQVVYDPAAHPSIRYEGSAQLRSGVLSCPKLPFEINGLSASLSVKDGVLTIERAEGYNGATTVRVAGGRIRLGDPTRNPFQLRVDLIDLELDKRLQDKTPPEFADLWRDFSPSGRISAALNIVREREGGPVGYAWTVDCRDVSMVYRYFKYPLDHVRGLLSFERQRITLDLQTLVGGKPLSATGTIDDPGPDAHVILDFRGEALPIDKTLFDALPPPIRKVVDEFQPTGTVGGTAHVERTKPTDPGDPPEGKVAVHAYLDLNERCGITWSGLPYPVGNLTGHLELHPDRWIFTNMRGSNGQAVITGKGRVEKVPGRGNPVNVDLKLRAENIPFNEQLRTALPPAWRLTWDKLNPVGSSDVDATIQVRPGLPDHYELVIDPKPETLVRLEFERKARPGVDPGGVFDLRMENVKGRFRYNDGPVEMRDVSFQFHGAPVRFASGKVVVDNSGRFQLGVKQVWARNVRIDAELRKMMPPIMGQFAQRFDEGRPIATIKGDLGLAWSGPGQAVLCDWDNALIVFNDNTIQAGLPLEHLQGQLDHVRGRYHGDELGVQGILRLDSVSLVGQQVTEMETPFHVKDGKAHLSSIRGNLLGGTISGNFDVSLDATPRYAASLAVDGVDLQRYARTLPGRQTFRGLVNARIGFTGFGNDLHTLQGQGEAHIVQGDIGELPVVFRLIKPLSLTAATKTMFDSADVALTIQNGESVFDPIRLTGDAFSLLGRGTMGIQGDLDLRLKPLYGRDRLHLPIVSDAMREAGGQLFVIRVQGPVAFPRSRLEPLPRVSDGFRSLGNRRAERVGRAQ